MTLHFLNDVTNDDESTQKIEIYVKMASLKSETMGKLINRIPGLRLFISSLPGSALRTHDTHLTYSLCSSTDSSLLCNRTVSET